VQEQRYINHQNTTRIQTLSINLIPLARHFCMNWVFEHLLLCCCCRRTPRDCQHVTRLELLSCFPGAWRSLSSSLSSGASSLTSPPHQITSIYSFSLRQNPGTLIIDKEYTELQALNSPAWWVFRRCFGVVAATDVI
jgi:hypothetical protein